MLARRLRIAGALALCGLLFAASPARAEEAPPERPKTPEARKEATPAAKPVAVVAAAGIDRLLRAFETIAASAERNDLHEQLKGFLLNLGNFEGFDRERPAGVMIFLGAGLPPQPEAVGFLPVKDVDRFLKTFALGQIRMQPVADKAGRFELVGPDGKLQVRIAEGWAFLGKTAESVEQNLPEPLELTRRFLEPYDLAGTFDLTAIPPGIKLVALGTLRAQVESNLQKQKGTEDEDRLHRALADEVLDALDDLSKEGERLVLGIAVSPEKKQARIEARLVRKTDTPVLPPDKAAPLNGTAERALLVSPRFAKGVDPGAAARLSVSAKLSERQRSILRDGVKVVRRKGVPAEAPADSPLARLFDSLAATAETGRIDFLAQFVGAAPDPLVLVGGVSVAKSDDLAAALPGLLEEARKAPNVASIQTNASTQQGIALHRLVGEKSSDDVDRLYGEKPSLLIGAGKDAFWFALGGTAAPDALGRLVAAGQPDSAETADAAPGGVDLAIQAGPWVALQRDNEDPRKVELLRSAFSRGQDGLRVRYRGTPAPNLQMEFESGWLRLIGLAAGRAIDDKRPR